MTCGDIRSYFEALEPGSGRRELATVVANHLRTCLSCGHEFREQIALLGVLNLVRDSAPVASPALDSAVLESFRKRASQASASSVILIPKSSRAWAPFWRGAVAAVVVLAAVVLFGYRKTGSKPPIQAVRFVQPGDSTQKPPALNSEASLPAKTTPIRVRPHRNAGQASAPAPRGAAAADERNPFPEDFHRLMYCDSLSCSGAMEVIRMQLPASAVESAGGAAAGNPVFADVVVGPDGIARGFRIVR